MFSRKHTKGRIDTVKRAHRTDLKLSDWNLGEYHKKDICEKLMKLDTAQPGFHPVDSVEASQISPDEFMRVYAMENKPVIIRDALAEWPAIKDGRWEASCLLKRFKHTLFKVGEDDNGRKLKIKMKTFMDYMSYQVDDSPLYLFESGMNGETSSLKEDYSIPEYFRDDFLNVVGRESKPPHKWFCIGPKRSGTTVHRDPLGTAAWNAVTHGYKRWILFEPKEDRKLVKGKKHRNKGEDDEAIHYFDFILPRLRRSNPSLKVYECIQGPGDIIFVPGQFWHGVLNLTDTIAVTHNYCGRDNFDDVCKRTSRQRPVFFKRWVSNMKKFSPVLYQRVTHLDQHPEDGKYVDCESSESSSDSSDSSDYSSSDNISDIEWFGFPTNMNTDN
jgi:histone arginine demethylase JMJD6